MIIFATENEHKLVEIKQILSGLNEEIVSLNDLPEKISIVEDGETFEENAMKKAMEVFKLTGKLTLSDDSGIEIDFLDKKPGVHSARYLGVETPHSEKVKHILKLMQDVPKEKRTARFVSVIACVLPDGTAFTTRGTIEGTIAFEQKGENGFGYDPIFYVDELEMTMSEMDMEMKNSISHRGKALRLMAEKLEKLL